MEDVSFAGHLSNNVQEQLDLMLEDNECDGETVPSLRPAHPHQVAALEPPAHQAAAEPPTLPPVHQAAAEPPALVP